MGVQTSYIQADASPTTFILPPTADYGDVVEIIGTSLTAKWTIQCGAGQIIHYGALQTTDGGTISAAAIGSLDVIKLKCISGYSSSWIVVYGPSGMVVT